MVNFCMDSTTPTQTIESSAIHTYTPLHTNSCRKTDVWEKILSFFPSWYPRFQYKGKLHMRELLSPHPTLGKWYSSDTSDRGHISVFISSESDFLRWPAEQLQPRPIKRVCHATKERRECQPFFTGGPSRPGASKPQPVVSLKPAHGQSLVP